MRPFSINLADFLKKSYGHFRQVTSPGTFGEDLHKCGSVRRSTKFPKLLRSVKQATDIQIISFDVNLLQSNKGFKNSHLFSFAWLKRLYWA